MSLQKVFTGNVPVRDTKLENFQFPIWNLGPILTWYIGNWEPKVANIGNWQMRVY